MYLIYSKKNSGLPKFNFTYSNFDDYYKHTSMLTTSFLGRYNLCVTNAKYNDIVEFLKVKEQYSRFNTYIFTQKPIIETLLLYKPDVNVMVSETNLEVYKRLVASSGLIFNKDAFYELYSSINHTESEMREAISFIKDNCKEQTVTHNFISKYYMIDDLVYPRTVLIAYLKMLVYRKSKLKKCMTQFDNDIIVGSFVKNSKLLLQEKLNYYKTGQGSDFIKTIPISNLILMLNVILYMRDNVNDIVILMKFYEEGFKYDTA